MWPAQFDSVNGKLKTAVATFNVKLKTAVATLLEVTAQPVYIGLGYIKKKKKPYRLSTMRRLATTYVVNIRRHNGTCY